MTLMSRLSGFSCRVCGGALGYLAILSTADTFLTPARRDGAACRLCGAMHRLRTTPGRRMLGLLPELALGLCVFLVIRALLYDDAISTAERSSFSLLGLLIFFPIFLLMTALSNRLRYTVVCEETPAAREGDREGME